jgi:hypothetical protein
MIKLGDITITQPTRDGYSLSRVRVVGRSATSLSGTLLELGTVWKRQWSLTFYVGSNLSALYALQDAGSFTFTDQDGTEITVKILGEISESQYPISTIGQVSLTLREV